MNEEVHNAKTKTKQAKIMGIKIPENYYWGDSNSKICGSVGGAKGDNDTKQAITNSNEK